MCVFMICVLLKNCREKYIKHAQYEQLWSDYPKQPSQEIEALLFLPYRLK